MTKYIKPDQVDEFIDAAQYKGRNPLEERKRLNLAKDDEQKKAQRCALLMGLRGTNLSKIKSKSMKPDDKYLNEILGMDKNLFIKLATAYPEYIALGRARSPNSNFPTTFLLQTATIPWTKDQWIDVNKLFCAVVKIDPAKFLALTDTIWGGCAEFLSHINPDILKSLKGTWPTYANVLATYGPSVISSVPAPLGSTSAPSPYALTASAAAPPASTPAHAPVAPAPSPASAPTAPAAKYLSLSSAEIHDRITELRSMLPTGFLPDPAIFFDNQKPGSPIPPLLGELHDVVTKNRMHDPDAVRVFVARAFIKKSKAGGMIDVEPEVLEEIEKLSKEKAILKPAALPPGPAAASAPPAPVPAAVPPAAAPPAKTP